MTQEQENLYEFLDQLKNWQQQLSDDAKENKEYAKTLKKKDRKFTHRYVAELESQAYAISQVYAEFEQKFDLGFKEVATFKEESKTMPGVFYDVIKLERINGETKFRLKLNGEYCCQPSGGVRGIGVLKFGHEEKVDLLVDIADCSKENIELDYKMKFAKTSGILGVDEHCLPMREPPVDFQKESSNSVVENAMRNAGFDGDIQKPFRSCKIDKD